MSKTGKTTDSDALSSFNELEERVGLVLEAFRTERKEKEALQGKLRAARTRLQTLEAELRSLQKDRKTVRARVQDLLREISALERQNLKEKEKRIV